MKIKASALYAYLSLPIPEKVSSDLLSIHIDTRTMNKDNLTKLQKRLLSNLPSDPVSTKD